MDSSSNPIFKLFADHIPPQYLLPFGVASVFFVWAYKEVKSAMTDQRDRVVTRLDKALEVYGKLQSAIINHTRGKDKEVTEKNLLEVIGQSHIYVSEDLYNELHKFIEYRNQIHLEACLSIIQNEIPGLRAKYRDKVPNLHDDLEHLIPEYGLIKRVLQPIGITVMFILAIAAIGVFYFVAKSQHSFNAQMDVVIIFLDLWLVGTTGFLFYRDRTFRKKRLWNAVIVLILLLGPVVIPYWPLKILYFVILLFVFDRMEKSLKRKQRGD